MEVHIELAAEELFKIGPFSITNSFLTMLLVMALILLVGAFVARRATLVPGRLQAMVELILEFLLGMTESAGGKSLGRRIFPLVSGLFIFIMLANYSGLLPGVGTVGINKESDHAEEAGEHTEEAAVYTLAAAGSDTPQSFVTGAADEEHGEVLVPFLRPPTADLNMTLAMALVTFVAVQVYGIRAHGVVGRLKHMADPPFLFPIELISEFSRIISLSARLFGNVFAGEALLGVMYAIGAKVSIAVIPIFVPVIFLFLELMFGTIQALVFAMLTLIYIAVAAAHGHDDEHEDAHKKEGAHAPAHGAGD
ncbi:MAG: F0F1 ATP synthase subunit A [Thermomicrobiales bacterium]|nr:F0F1 ATP synthase subunit A [Thermomicrobiales bacterium]